jgi:hypothetical protein
MTTQDFFKQYPNKNLNDYYSYVKKEGINNNNTNTNTNTNTNSNTNTNTNTNEISYKNKEEISYKEEKSRSFRFLPYLLILIIGIGLGNYKWSDIKNYLNNGSSENLILINYESNEQLEIAPNDLDEKMSLDDARKSCESLGNGWRLPTMTELKIMHNELHLKGKGNFKKDVYWSDYSTTINGYDYDFNNGGSPYDPTISPDELLKKPRWVRPVRSIKNKKEPPTKVQDDPKRQIFCPNCNGTGKEKYPCGTCKGDGIYEEYRLKEGRKMPYECHICRGYGFHETSCKVCGGGGKVYE